MLGVRKHCLQSQDVLPRQSQQETSHSDPQMLNFTTYGFAKDFLECVWLYTHRSFKTHSGSSISLRRRHFLAPPPDAAWDWPGRQPNSLHDRDKTAPNLIATSPGPVPLPNITAKSRRPTIIPPTLTGAYFYEAAQHNTTARHCDIG